MLHDWPQETFVRRLDHSTFRLRGCLSVFAFIPLASWAVVAPMPCWQWRSRGSTKTEPPLPGRQRGLCLPIFGKTILVGPFESEKTPFCQRVKRTGLALSGSFCFQGRCVRSNEKGNAIFYRETGVFMRTGFYSNSACILFGEESVPLVLIFGRAFIRIRVRTLLKFACES